MKNAIEFLKKDRRVNDTFKKRLEQVGLEIEYGEFSYWHHQPYIQIGRNKVFLVKIYTEYGRSGLESKFQNEVISEIYETIKTEKEIAENADKVVEEFFDKLKL